MKDRLQSIPSEIEPKDNKQRVAILDAGAQYGKVIDRKIRALSVESVILPMDTPADELSGYSAIIISGGPKSVYAQDAPAFDPKIFDLDIPMLGICYGMQLMAREAGGKVATSPLSEYGTCSIRVEPDSLLFSGLDADQVVVMSHGDSVMEVPEGYRAIGNSKGLIAAIENPSLKRYGVQFHPEVEHTAHGNDILRNFLYEISGLKGDYTMEDRKEKAVLEIREKVGLRKVIMLVSGGVDSTVCATLLKEAIGAENIIAIHIDNGFMRERESQNVKEALEAIGLTLNVIDASEEFYAQVAGIIDPEEKRKRIGDTFMAIADKEIRRLGLNDEDTVIAQGTLRPDLIESASKYASKGAEKIKTHHNDTQAVRILREAGRVIEPLSDYHKDEVRELGIQLGLPEELVWRQPFPGPGLAIRVICAEEPYRGDDFQETQDALVNFESDAVRASLLPIQTVGVGGDGRSYNYCVGLSGERDWLNLLHLANEIPKSIHSVNRVVYIFGEPVVDPITKITPTYLTRDVVQQLRQADAIVNEILLKYGLLKKLSQVPVILFPVHFGEPGNRSIAIRTIMTGEYMTGVPAIPGKDIPEEALQEMVSRILNEVDGISRVVYDLTSKPPGTIEWE